ncbi:MAG: PorV/PorQ family protein [Candidatus Goldiibacteriota bacterium]
MHLKAVKKTVVIAVLLSLFSSGLFADQGTTGAVFLKLEQGARPISLGGAFVAAADDVNAISWNPAGLPQIEGTEVSLMHAVWIVDIFYDYIAAAYSAGEIGTFGMSLVYVNYGSIQSWDELGNPEGDFSGNDIAVNLAYGTVIDNKLSLGIAVKGFNQSIDEEGAFGFAADIGAIYKLPIEGLQAGMSVQNLGPKFGFGEAFLLPVILRAGLSYTGIRNFMLNLEYAQPIETNGIIAAGMEYWYRDLLVLRMGYQYQGMFDKNRYYENYAGPSIMAGFVIGAGIKIDIYEIDYAYRQLGVLGSAHRAGLTVKFP